jgi:hypothetical protein
MIPFDVREPNLVDSEKLAFSLGSHFTARLFDKFAGRRKIGAKGPLPSGPGYGNSCQQRSKLH